MPRTTPVRPRVNERKNAAVLIMNRSFETGTFTALDARTRTVRHRLGIAVLAVLHRKCPWPRSPARSPAGRFPQLQLVPGPRYPQSGRSARDVPVPAIEGGSPQ